MRHWLLIGLVAAGCSKHPCEQNPKEIPVALNGVVSPGGVGCGFGQPEHPALVNTVGYAKVYYDKEHADNGPNNQMALAKANGWKVSRCDDRDYLVNGMFTFCGAKNDQQLRSVWRHEGKGELVDVHVFTRKTRAELIGDEKLTDLQRTERYGRDIAILQGKVAATDGISEAERRARIDRDVAIITGKW